MLFRRLERAHTAVPINQKVGQGDNKKKIAQVENCTLTLEGDPKMREMVWRVRFG